MNRIDLQQHVATLERELQWARLKIQALTEELRLERIKKYGPQSDARYSRWTGSRTPSSVKGQQSASTREKRETRLLVPFSSTAVALFEIALREDLQNKASGLNLAVAAIILWNTVYLQKAVQMLADEGTPVPPECMPHFSPLGWEHINMTGDYVWSLQRVTTLEKLRPLRRHRLPSKGALPYSQKAAGGSSRP